METNQAMKQQNLKYFSQLSAKQKDKTILNIRVLKHNLTGLPMGLSKSILSEIDDNILIDKLLKSKLFKHENNYYPINFKETILQAENL